MEDEKGEIQHPVCGLSQREILLWTPKPTQMNGLHDESEIYGLA